MTGLNVEALTAGYQKRPVLKGLSLEVVPGKISGIIGPNGCGKTTLFRCICGMVRPWSGSIRVGGEDIRQVSGRKLARLAAFIPQLQGMPFPFTVEEYVLMGRYPHRGRLMPFSREDRRIVEETLDMLDLLELKGQQVQRLSGGEMQRVFLAGGLAQKPEILLMDEPTSHLDIGHQVRLLDLIGDLTVSSGLTVLIILHDLNLASAYCEKVALMAEGTILSQGSPEDVITEKNIEQAYRTPVDVGKDPVTARPFIFFARKDRV
jgi:iron complex transport system ATP-binding protein